MIKVYEAEMTTMTTTALTAEKTRLTDRIAKIDIERGRLIDQLSDIEATERVLAQFTSGGAAPPRPRGRPRIAANEWTAIETVNEATKPAPKTKRTRTRANAGSSTISMADAVLEACGTFPGGGTAKNILPVVEKLLGSTVRANHLGIALQRHARAGRTYMQNGLWYLTAPAATAKAA
jgi:hypothetical protein